MTEQQMGDLERILTKIRGLIANAEDEGNTEEARESYRARAEALMFKYRIDEATKVKAGFFGTGEAATVAPVWRVLPITKVGSEFSTGYQRIASSCAHHVGARGVTTYEDGNLVLKVVGYMSDLLYMEVLLTSCVLEFGKRLEPKVDPTLSIQENAYHMRHAGMERKRITRLLLGDWDTINEMKAKNRKISNMVKAECRKRGENPDLLLGRGNNMKTYRDSYAQGFVNTISHRLWRMRMAHGEEGAGLVLADRSERVNEAFYAEYPMYRPSNEPYKAANEDCEKCRRAKSGYCREHSWMRPVKGRETRLNGRAYDQGSTAAAMVDLGANATGRPKAGRGDSMGELG
jgi:Protein of unknown function (DUF2786)